MIEIVKEKAVVAAITTIVSFVVGGLLTWLVTKKANNWIMSKRNKKKKEIEEIREELKRMQERDEVFKKSIRSMLRQNIIDTHNKYMSRGWAEIYVKDNMQDMFDNYTALDGNGTTPGLVEEFMRLPIREEDAK